MKTTTRWGKVQFCAVLPMLLAIGCGGESPTLDPGNNAAPAEIPGGGIGSGAIDGTLNVYATDADTKEPIAGAKVYVGEADAAELLEATTDATGLATFKNSVLQGATTITVTATDYAATTWMGVNGANVTIPLGSGKAPTVETAQASGTIAGFDSLVNATNHVFIAFVSYSWSGGLGDPSNDIQQPQGMGLAPNACIKLPPPAPAQPCAWSLVTRTGKQMRYALIIDVDTKGTFMDQADDTRSLYGFAFKTGIDLKAGDNSTGESLEMFPMETLVDLNVTMPAVPAGLDESLVVPLLDMGDEGQLPFFFGQEVSVNKVPGLSGIFASGRYDFIARASVKGKPFPSTLRIERQVDITKPVTLPAYQATPTDLAANGGTYSFKPAADATIHSVNFRASMGERAWGVTIYDGRTSFALPTLSPDPLPVGNLTMVVDALTVPGVNVQDFEVTAAQDQLTAVSDNGIDITH